MAHIAIFCDGTWSNVGSGTHTHVLRLAQACDQNALQQVRYFPGVGTGTGMVSDLGRWLSKVGGGLFGWGLNGTIKAAYRDLCELYQPGDKIIIFGFSRGAYTARSLAGMIRKCGILNDPTPRNVTRAFTLYRKRGARHAPDMPRVWAKRRALSPDFATSPEDVIRRNDHSYLVRITYLGIWDTVGALGIPNSVLGRVATLWNKRYAFHDTSLSRLVESARHAVALDERRVLFEPSLWNNLTPSEGDPGLNFGDVSDGRPYQQIWFAGNHSIVGGSGEAQNLAAIPLSWVWQGAAISGLMLAADQSVPHLEPDLHQPAPELDDVSRIYEIFPWLLQWRRGPSDLLSLHLSALKRAEADTKYRPLTLTRAAPRLFKPRE